MAEEASDGGGELAFCMPAPPVRRPHVAKGGVALGSAGGGGGVPAVSRAVLYVARWVRGEKP